jgi:hypothetical protein
MSKWREAIDNLLRTEGGGTFGSFGSNELTKVKSENTREDAVLQTFGSFDSSGSDIYEEKRLSSVMPVVSQSYSLELKSIYLFENTEESSKKSGAKMENVFVNTTDVTAKTDESLETQCQRGFAVNISGSAGTDETDESPAEDSLSCAQRVNHDTATPAPDWPALAASGKSDRDVDDLDQGAFLFALRKVQQTERSGLGEVWARFAPYWRERLPGAAWRLVEAEYQRRTQPEESPVDARQLAMNQQTAEAIA